MFGAKGRRVAGAAGFGATRARRGLRPQGRAPDRPGLPHRRRASAQHARQLRRASRRARQEGAGRRRAHGQPQGQARLQGLGLDLTEHGDADSVEVAPARRGRRAHAAQGRLPLHGQDRRPRQAHARQPARRTCATRAARRRQRPAQRQHRVPPPGRLRARAQAARDALPEPRQAAHAAAQDGRGPRRRRHRDHDQPLRHPGRQADLPQHGHPPRPRVAVGRARDGVGLRPADQLRQEGERAQARPAHAQHRHPGRQPRRLQHLARGRAAGRLLALRLRDEAQELQASR